MNSSGSHHLSKCILFNYEFPLRERHFFSSKFAFMALHLQYKINDQPCHIRPRGSCNMRRRQLLPLTPVGLCPCIVQKKKKEGQAFNHYIQSWSEHTWTGQLLYTHSQWWGFSTTLKYCKWFPGLGNNLHSHMFHFKESLGRACSHFEKSAHLSKVCSHQGWYYTHGDDGKWCLFLKDRFYFLMYLR